MAEHVKCEQELDCTTCCIRRFKEELCDCDGEFCKRYKSIGDADDFKKAVLAKADAPSIDIRVGKWTEYIDEQHGGLMGRCSACGKSTLYAVSYDLFGNRHEMRYCPNCGARMDGKEQEHD